MAEELDKRYEEGSGKRLVRTEVRIRERQKRWAKENNLNISKFMRYKLDELIKNDELSPKFIKRDYANPLSISEDE